MRRRFDAVVVSCEHASNAVPARWRGAFRGRQAVLDSHRGWDPGAALLARELAAALKAPLLMGEVTRLLIDLNRGEGHRRLLSEFTPPEDRALLLERYHRPYRAAVREAVRAAGGRVLHLSVHSFTPELGGRVRDADIGLLYDPARDLEREFARDWRRDLRAALPGLRVRMNYPYRGTADGLTRDLRREFGGARYAGIELEVNQAIAGRKGAVWRDVRKAIPRSLGVPDRV